MEVVDNLNNQDQDQDPPPHMSGAYIRTLVKQLRTPTHTHHNPSDAHVETSNNLSKMPQNLTPQHHKKQVRRRLHTTRPYQERLLNMAEARREIVTALKFHRAAMKKAAAAGDQHPHTPPPPEPPHEAKIKPRKIPKTYPSPSPYSRTDNNIPSNYLHNFTSKNVAYPSFPSNSFAWSPFPIAASHSVADNLDIALPEQTLGLNLNFHDFSNLDANLFTNGSASSSSSSHSPSIATDQEAPHSISVASDGGTGSGSGGGGGGLHVAVGDEEMAEIRSIGEKHEMEWSDKMNLVKSAWWVRFMKAEEDEEEEGFEIHHPFDQILEFPDWMNNGNEQLLNDYCSEDYHLFHDDPALPRMDIGEFEGMDGEWLA